MRLQDSRAEASGRGGDGDSVTEFSSSTEDTSREAANSKPTDEALGRYQSMFRQVMDAVIPQVQQQMQQVIYCSSS